MNNIENIINLINQNDKFLIVSHENPDCDAIGSMIALYSSIEKMGKKALMYNKDGVPEYLRFLSNSSKITKSLHSIDDDINVVVILDCAEPSRPGAEFEEFISKKGFEVAYVDHHKTNGINSRYALIDECVSSTGVLVYKVIKELKVDIDATIAESIFTTILGDTGSFRYSNTYAETFEIAGEMVELGADPAKISKRIFDEEPYKKIKLLKLVLDTLEVDDSGKVAFIYVDQEMFKMTDTNKEYAEGIVNFPRSIKGVEVAAFFKQDEGNRDNWKVSLRSKDYVDVSAIARKYGGGGHHKASGYKSTGTLEEVKSSLYSTITDLI